ncbi:PAS-domain containing protein [soil metagenome]
MQSNVRTIAGPILTAAVVLTTAAMPGQFAPAPDLAPVFVALVVCAAAIGGIGSGLMSAAIVVGYAAMALSDAGINSPAGLLPLVPLAFGAVTAATVTGLVRAGTVCALTREQERQATGARLAAALDQTTIGIVLLDADTRAEFINRAFRDAFALPDELADSKPPFIALMYHGRDNRLYALPEDEVDGFIARRTELIRAGDTSPVDIKLADGQVLRLTCTPLPDGGRMLSYSSIADLIRHDDDPARLAEYQSLRGGDVFASRPLRAAE